MASVFGPAMRSWGPMPLVSPGEEPRKRSERLLRSIPIGAWPAEPVSISAPQERFRMEMDRIRKIKRSDTGTRRYCRYMRLGLVDFMVCSNGFECWRCEVDQRMEDRFGMHPAFALKPAKNKEPVQVSGFTYLSRILLQRGTSLGQTDRPVYQVRVR